MSLGQTELDDNVIMEVVKIKEEIQFNYFLVVLLELKGETIKVIIVLCLSLH